MDPKLQAVIDRAEILDVLHQYVHACDRGDEPRPHRYLSSRGPDDARLSNSGHALRSCLRSDRQRETMPHLLAQPTIHLTATKPARPISTPQLPAPMAAFAI